MIGDIRDKTHKKEEEGHIQVEVQGQVIVDLTLEENREKLPTKEEGLIQEEVQGQAVVAHLVEEDLQHLEDLQRLGKITQSIFLRLAVEVKGLIQNDVTDLIN